MLDINYELIYKAEPFSKKIIECEININKAKNDLKIAKQEYKEKISELTKIPLEELDFTNNACMARNVLFCVYTGNVPKGLGKRKCIFCGCDDFDEI